MVKVIVVLKAVIASIVWGIYVDEFDLFSKLFFDRV